jgi:hypothetical protein
LWTALNRTYLWRQHWEILLSRRSPVQIVNVARDLLEVACCMVELCALFGLQKNSVGLLLQESNLFCYHL